MWPFRKKSPIQPEELERIEIINRARDRYVGKPFLKLLDSYVLKAIGHLDSETEMWLQSMLPKLQETFQSSVNWPQIVEEQMDFPESLPNEIKRRWEEGKERFVSATGSEPSPLEFTYVFVDTNFQPTNH